jgi:excisionase family DNA binding protein
MNTENLIGTKIASEILGVSQRHIRWLISEGRLKAKRLGRDMFLQRKAVEKYDGPRRNRKKTGANGIAVKG